MRRRISGLFLMILFIILLSSCQNRNILLFLNWGEYVDEAMLEEFERIYNCEVVMDLGESNEIFYSKVRGGTTCYDVVAPSDYMVEKMYHNDMLAKIDFSRIPNYDLENRMPGVKGIAETLEAKEPGITEYYVPYLWGTWGIMYSTLKEGLEEAVLSSENQWSCLFDRSILPANTQVAMYDSHLHAYYAVCRYLGLDTDKELEQGDLDKIYQTIKNVHFDAWGTDDIKKDIVAKNRDLGFMWTGDFLYYYCENIANVVMDAYLAGDVKLEEISSMVQILTSEERVYKEKYQVGFDIFIPTDTVAFCDNLVIPKTAAHYDLALNFINFMCGRTEGVEEVDPAFANTYYVSYNSPYLDVYADILSLKNSEFSAEDFEIYTKEMRNGIDSYDSSLFWKVYDTAIGIAFEKYYPKEENIPLPDGSVKRYRGDILNSFSRTYINKINSTFNNARA